MDEKLDVVGYWTELKLNIIKEYAKAYASIMSKQSPIQHYAYVDAFAGAGTLKSKESGEEIDGSSSMAIIKAYQARLKDVAGFKYVPDPMPMRNKKGVEIYYLFFASSNKTGSKIATSIFEKYKNLGI